MRTCFVGFACMVSTSVGHRLFGKEANKWQTSGNVLHDLLVAMMPSAPHLRMRSASVSGNARNNFLHHARLRQRQVASITPSMFMENPFGDRQFGQSEHDLMASSAPLVFSRRSFATSAATLLSLAMRSSSFAVGGLSREALLKRLQGVPLFVVTNIDASPYLTEVDADGRRSGFFYFSPKEAIDALKKMQAFDPKASLNIVALDDVYFKVSETAQQVAAAPQPKSGTSDDFRLFRLRPLVEEKKAVAFLTSKSKSKSEFSLDEDVPLFYEPSLKIPSADGTLQSPYFFRYSDLTVIYENYETQRKSGDKSVPAFNDPPRPEITTLAGLVRALETGEAPDNSVIVPASEAIGIVGSMRDKSTLDPETIAAITAMASGSNP